MIIKQQKNYIWLSELLIINLLPGNYIKCSLIKSCIGMFWTVKVIIFYGNAMRKLQKVMLEVKPLLGKFCRLIFGGHKYLNMINNMLISVIFVKDFVDHLSGMSFLFIQ